VSEMWQNLRVSFFLAYEYLTRGNKGITLFTIFLLALVFLQLVFFSAILGGVTEKFDSQIIDFQTGNVVIEPKEDQEYIEKYDRLLRKINALPEVTGVSARTKSAGKIEYEDKEVGATILGIDPDDENTVTKIDSAVVEGDFISKLDRREIILGRELSGGYGAVMETRSLGGLEAGDTVTVTMGPVQRDFRVKGIYTTFFFLSDSSAYINKADMDEMLGLENKANEICIRLNPGVDEEEFRTELLSLGVNENIRVWKEFTGIIELLTSTLSKIRNILNIIGLLVTFVIIFVVIYVNIINKRKEIGVQKAIGIDKNVIICSFVLQAAFYAFCGIMIGFVIMQYMITPATRAHPIWFPVGFVTLRVSNDEALFRALLLFGAAIIASIIPTRKLVNMDLLELIWGG
jgi:putative ABC transport system permease protein